MIVRRSIYPLLKLGIVAFPISLFWFAWTSYKSVHWIVPIIASALWGWSFYTLILMTYNYTEDSYKASQFALQNRMRKSDLLTNIFRSSALPHSQASDLFATLRVLAFHYLESRCLAT